MRLIRTAVPAAVIAVLWLASARLEFGWQNVLGPVRRILAVVAPGAVQPQDLTAPAPWAFLMIALSMLALAAIYAALLALVRRQTPVAETATTVFAPYSGRPQAPDPAPATASAGTTFAAYWLCAVASGFLVAAIPLVVGLAVTGVAGQSPFGLAAELGGAALWGLVFGWIPALVAIALDNAGSDRRALQRWAIAVPAALVLLLAATWLGLPGPGVHTAEPQNQAQNPTSPEPVPTPPIPTGPPVPIVAPGDWQVDPLWCTSGQLAMTAGVPDAALGSRGMLIHAQNVGDAACVVESYPDVAFSNILSGALDVSVDHGGGMLGEDPGVSRIELQPGATVVSTLTWKAMPRGITASWLYLAGYSGAERQAVQVETDISGGTVAVTAWGLPAA